MKNKCEKSKLQPTNIRYAAYRLSRDAEAFIYKENNTIQVFFFWRCFEKEREWDEEENERGRERKCGRKRAREREKWLQNSATRRVSETLWDLKQWCPVDDERRELLAEYSTQWCIQSRPVGSDPRVGDGLVWNPLPMAFKYTFLDRMQRS